MRFLDFCKFSIERYPTLYAKKTDSDSFFSVAHHCFIIFGNGLRWTRYKKDNYLIKKTDDDVPYDTVRYDGDNWKKFVDSRICYFEDSVRLLDEVEGKISKEPKGFNRFWFERPSEIIKHRMERPSPYFEKQSSILWEIDPQIIAEDWRYAAVDHIYFWLKFFNGNVEGLEPEDVNCQDIDDPRFAARVKENINFCQETLARLTKP